MINLNQRLSIVCHLLKRGTLADIGLRPRISTYICNSKRLMHKSNSGEVIQGPYKAAKKKYCKL